MSYLQFRHVRSSSRAPTLSRHGIGSTQSNSCSIPYIYCHWDHNKWTCNLLANKSRNHIHMCHQPSILSKSLKYWLLNHKLNKYSEVGRYELSKYQKRTKHKDDFKSREAYANRPLHQYSVFEGFKLWVLSWCLFLGPHKWELQIQEIDTFSFILKRVTYCRQMRNRYCMLSPITVNDSLTLQIWQILYSLEFSQEFIGYRYINFYYFS